MVKIAFMGAGSTVFAKNVLGDCMLTPALSDSEIALYDIDGKRLEESALMLGAINNNVGNKATIKTYLGVENRKDALRGAAFVVNAIQVGLYEPCTVTDFEVPKKYGLRQTIADTLGIGGIMRALRTIPVLEDFARDMDEVCSYALFLIYTNPMAMLTGAMLRMTPIKTVGLCHSVQSCAKNLLEGLGMPYDEQVQWKIAGINHQAWLLELTKDGRDLYPEVKRRAEARTEKHGDMVRYEIMKRFGYYVTESSEHNAEYMPFFIKDKYPELIERFNIPLDEYPRRSVKHRPHHQPAAKRGGRGALHGGRHRHRAHGHRGFARAVRGHEPHEHQRAAPHHRGGAHAEEGIHLSGGDDGPALPERAFHRRHRGDVRRPDRRARGLAAEVQLSD